MPEEEKVEHVLRGLQVHYIDRILPFEPKTVVRVLEIARLIDDARERLQNEVNMVAMDAPAGGQQRPQVEELLSEVLALLKKQQLTQRTPPTWSPPQRRGSDQPGPSTRQPDPRPARTVKGRPSDLL